MQLDTVGTFWRDDHSLRKASRDDASFCHRDARDSVTRIIELSSFIPLLLTYRHGKKRSTVFRDIYRIISPNLGKDGAHTRT